MRVKVEVWPWLSETLGARGAEKRVLEQQLPDGTTLRALLACLHQEHARFGELVFDPERGRLTGHTELALNGAIYDLVGGLDARLQDGDVVTFLPSLAGG
jgi:molybdopterin converting factor small subunit